MKVLSLFDGMSCGYIALQQAGIPIAEYHTFENDKYAIQASKIVTNDVNVIRHGEINLFTDFTQFKGFDLIMGGFPCQAFSGAGKQKGMKDQRGILFFEFVRALKEAQPKYFLAENVKMKQEYLNIINHHLEVTPVFINSALVSAQNRQRFYWCNWRVTQPRDRGIFLKDIIENGSADREKSLALLESYSRKCATPSGLREYKEKNMGQLIYTGGAIRGRYTAEGTTQQQLEVQITEKANALTSVQKDSILATKPIRIETLGKGGQGQRIYSKEGKSIALSANGGGMGAKTGLYDINEGDVYWRKLTPRECFRLQTIPENIIDKLLASGISNNQLYKLAGNGWTIEVITHILNHLIQPF